MSLIRSSDSSSWTGTEVGNRRVLFKRCYLHFTALFGTLSGNTRDVIHKFSVDLPKKHGRGGQSALRFARLREEKRHNYVRKVAELAVQNYITTDKVNVAGLVLAGSADFKNDLNQSDMFDNRLQSKVIKVVDVSYGGENGFNQAIDLASETLSNVKFIQEKRLINVRPHPGITPIAKPSMNTLDFLAAALKIMLIVTTRNISTRSTWIAAKYAMVSMIRSRLLRLQLVIFSSSTRFVI